MNSVENVLGFHFHKLRHLRLPKIRRVRTARRVTRRTHPDYTAHKHVAREVIMARLQHFADEYAKLDSTHVESMKFRRVSIRNQKSRWGSCSAQKNLNFNYRLVHLAPELRDYVIVHELCHLVELNHGPQFWALTEKMIPNARALSHQVRRMSIK